MLQHLLRAIRSISGIWTILRVSTRNLAHRARKIVALLSTKTPDFIGLQYWPQNSLDLNPVDYVIRGILQSECRPTVARIVT